MAVWLSWLERTTDNRKVGGSSPLGPTISLRHGGLAQLGERLICIQEVSGSIPLFSTTANADNCTLKTEQRKRRQKQGNRGRGRKIAKLKANVENFNLIRVNTIL